MKQDLQSGEETVSQPVPTEKGGTPNFPRWPAAAIACICASIFAAALLAYAYIGTFTRWMADDYCGAADIKSSSLWANVQDYYHTWDGRFASDVLNLLAQGAGPRLVPVLPGFLILCWLVVLILVIRELGKLLGWHHVLLSSVLLSEFFLYSMLESAPNTIQSFYWETGQIVYAFPLVLLTGYLGILFHLIRSGPGKKRTAWLVISAITTFVAGGCSETYVGMQTGGLMLGIVLAPRYLKRVERSLILPGLLGSSVAFALVATAPGNAVRQSFLPFHRDLPQQLSNAVLYSFYFIYRWIVEHPVTFLLCILLFAGVALTCNASRTDAKVPTVAISRIQMLLGGNIAVFLVVLASVLPAYYGIGARPPDRAMVAAQFVLICATAWWGYLIGSAVKMMNIPAAIRPYAFAAGIGALGLAVLFGPANTARSVLRDKPVFQTYAAEWDKQDRAIRLALSQGKRSLVMQPLPVRGYGGLDLPGPNPAGGFNVCIARYYGLDSIAFRSEP